MIPLLNRGGLMKGFIQGVDRQQTTLLPECLDDWVGESNPIRAVDVFVDALELRDLGFDGVDPAATGRPAYHLSPMLKLYIYGYLNRVQSSRRLEREAGRNLEVMWLTGRLAPDYKTIADSRKDNGSAIKKVCAQFVELCRKMGLLAKASVAIDGSKFKKQIEESVARYMSQLDTADRQTVAGEDPSEAIIKGSCATANDANSAIVPNAPFPCSWIALVSINEHRNYRTFFKTWSRHLWTVVHLHEAVLSRTWNVHFT
jgi:transposase